jgi:histone H3/H4
METPKTEQVEKQPEVKAPKDVVVDDTKISTARVRSLFEKEYVNGAATNKIKELKSELAPYVKEEKFLKDGKEEQLDPSGKPIVDGKNFVIIPLTEQRRKELEEHIAKFKTRRDAIEKEMSALSASRIRFSDGVSVALCHLLEDVVTQLVEHSMNACKKGDKKIVSVEHMHADGANKLAVFPLIKSLPSWVNPPAAPVKQPKTEGEKKEKAAKKAESTNSFEYYIAHIAREIAQPPVIVDGKYSFTTVKNAKSEDVRRRVTKTDGPFHGMRISSQAKQYIDQLLLEFLQRLSPLIQLHLQSVKVKTVSEQTLIQVIKSICLDGVKSAESLVYKTVKVADPEFLKAEKTRKALAKTEGKPFEAAKEVKEIEVLQVEKVLKFEDTGFDALLNNINEKLKAFHEKKVEAEKQKAEKPVTQPAVTEPVKA